MKALRTIALLTFSFLAVRGEAATSAWGVASASPVLRMAVADQRVTFNINVQGLGDSAATVYLLTTGIYGIDDYNWTVKGLRNPADIQIGFNAPVVDGKATTRENFVRDEFDDINNLYYEIFVDSDHYMLARVGEDPNFTITLTQVDYEYDEPCRWNYDLSTTVEFKNGYIAPFHEGPDPISTPEPTSGALLLVGAALLALRRRIGD